MTILKITNILNNIITYYSLYFNSAYFEELQIIICVIYLKNEACNFKVIMIILKWQIVCILDVKN